ncbi:hypothetical protein B0H67DRAFT_578809 [Lasiosphaeris hirsuta]|uniref:Uncharacterized protein n=1 Tax=Lasiosphaeris hirsuta TaxID=260670 RepID=A0AA40AFB6_9PEZI|nr:hypothetical protein B0H67DRAFT_578809 [Lasiosphaeris hirsuta]
MDSSSTPFLTANNSMDEPGDSRYEDAEPDPAPKRGRPSSQRRHLSTTFHAISYLLAIWGFAALLLQLTHHSLLASSLPLTRPAPDVYRPSTLPAGLNICDCGSSIQEALSLGCVYDMLATAWLPLSCRDDALTAEFDRAGPGPDGAWSYFADEEGAIPLTISEVAALGGTGNNTFWASRQWHVVHCLFYWQKLWRMRNTGAIMEERFDNMAHIRHCGTLILNPHPPARDRLVEVPVMMNSSMAAHVAAGKTREGHHPGHPQAGRDHGN